MLIWKALCAPALVSTGAAVPVTLKAACAEAGSASSEASAMSIPIRRRGLMPLRSFPQGLLAVLAPMPRGEYMQVDSRVLRQEQPVSSWAGYSVGVAGRFHRVRPTKVLRDLPHPNDLRGDAADDCIGRHVARHDGVRADDGVVANPDPSQEAGAVADPDVRADHAIALVDPLHPDRALDLDDAVIEVDEHRPVRDHALLADADTLVCGDGALLPEDGLGPDLDHAFVAADLGAVADPSEPAEFDRCSTGYLELESLSKEHGSVRLPSPSGRRERPPPGVSPEEPGVAPVEHPVRPEESEQPQHGGDSRFRPRP